MTLPSRSSEARSRARDPRHDGTADAIRNALRRSPEPLSVYKLCLQTGIPPEKIRTAICHMMSRGGSVVSVKGPGPKRVCYTLYEKQQKKDERPNGRVAGRITIPQFRWDGTRLG